MIYYQQPRPYECKMKYQHHDTCILCHQHGTRDHIIRCTAPSRIKWRQQYICALRKRLETKETEFAEWLETGEVNVSNYPIKYANAILSQERIGWRHFFAGKISKEWLKLQADSTNTVMFGEPQLSKSHQSILSNYGNNGMRKSMVKLQSNRRPQGKQS
jgi:hypothetical protein